MTEDELEQGALFEIEWPDEGACVWLTGEGGIHINLGPRDAVAEKMKSRNGSLRR